MKILRKICAREHLFSTIFVFLLTVLVVSFSSSPFVVTYAEVPEDSWISKESMPTARSGHGVAVVNGKIYAIGGYNGTQLRLSTNEEYDPLTDTWNTKTPMPTRRSSFGIAVYQNKIYVIGGANGTDPTTGSDILCSFNEVYDPLTDTWSTKASLPTPRRELDANVVDGKIYLIGGYRYISGKIQEFNTNEVYDPSTNTWTTKTPLPTATSFYASAVLDKKIYVIGGPGRKINQIYDPETDTWSYGASAPVDVYGAAAGATTGVAAPKRIYFMGGGVPLFPSKANLVYDPERDAWSNCTYMLTARDGLGVAVVDDVLYAIGGLIFTGELAGTPVGAVEQYTPFGYGTIPPTQHSEPFPTTWIIAAVVIIAVVGVALLLYFRKIRKTTVKTE